MLRILQINTSLILNSLRLGETTVIGEEHTRRTKTFVYGVKYFFQVDVCRRKYKETEIIWKILCGFSSFKKYSAVTALGKG